jgi:hypothetical protein
MLKSVQSTRRKRKKQEAALQLRQTRKKGLSNKGKKPKASLGEGEVADVDRTEEDQIADETGVELGDGVAVTVEAEASEDEDDESDDDGLLCPHCQARQMPLGEDTHVSCSSCHATLEVLLEEDGVSQRLVIIEKPEQGGKSISGPSKRLSHKTKKLRYLFSFFPAI